MADSAFDGVHPDDAEYIRSRLLAGDSMADVRRGLPFRQIVRGRKGGADITAKLLREMRDEVFDPLQADPEAVKELAQGPVLNALDIVRYRRRPGRKPRMARPSPVQTEMFPA